MTDLESRGWLLDELTTAGEENLDADHVARYDRKTGDTRYDDVDWIVALGLPPEGTFVDLGAGTGRVALAVAGSCRRVVAVDVSPPMLSYLRERVDALGLRNVEVEAAGFLTYRHTGDPADVVYSRNALHHLPDFWKAVALARIRSMLRAGGVLRLRDLVYSFDLAEMPARIDAWIAGAPTDPEAGWTRSDLEVHMRDEHSTFTWLLEPMIERAGFEIVDAEYSENGIFAAYVCAVSGPSPSR